MIHKKKLFTSPASSLGNQSNSRKSEQVEDGSENPLSEYEVHNINSIFQLQSQVNNLLLDKQKSEIAYNGLLSSNQQLNEQLTEMSQRAQEQQEMAENYHRQLQQHSFRIQELNSQNLVMKDIFAKVQRLHDRYIHNSIQSSSLPKSNHFTARQSGNFLVNLMATFKTIKIKDQQIVEQSKQIQALSTKVSNYQKQNQIHRGNYCEKITELKKEVDQHAKQACGNEHRHQQEIQEVNRICDQIKSECHSAKEQIQRLEVQNRCYLGEIGVLRRQLHQYKDQELKMDMSESAMLRQENNQLRLQNSELCQEYQTLLRKFNNLLDENALNIEKIAWYETEHEQSKSAYKGLDSEFKIMQLRNQQLKEQLSRREEDKLINTISSLREHKDSVAHLTESSITAIQTKMRISELEEQNNVLHKKMADKVKQFQECLQLHQKSRSTLEQQLQRIKSELSIKESVIESLESRTAVCQQSAIQSQKQCSAKSLLLSELTVQKQSLDYRIKVLSQSQVSLYKQVEQVKDQNNQMMQQNKALIGTTYELREQISEIQNDYVKVRGTAQTIKQDNEKLKKKLSRSEKEKNEWKFKYEKLQKNRSEEISRLSQEKIALLGGMNALSRIVDRSITDKSTIKINKKSISHSKCCMFDSSLREKSRNEDIPSGKQQDQSGHLTLLRQQQQILTNQDIGMSNSSTVYDRIEEKYQPRGGSQQPTVEQQQAIRYQQLVPNNEGLTQQIIKAKSFPYINKLSSFPRELKLEDQLDVEIKTLKKQIQILKQRQQYPKIE